MTITKKRMTRAVAALLAVLAVFGAFMVSGPETMAAGLPSSYVSAGTYVLVPECAPNSAVEVSNSGKSNGDRVQIWERAWDSKGNIIATQTVKVEVVGINTVVLLNGNSGKCLDVCDQSKSAGAAVHQWQISSLEKLCRASAQWKLKSAGGGYYYLINSNSGKALDVSNASSSNGTGLIQYTLNYSSAQKFKFVPVSNYRKITIPIAEGNYVLVPECAQSSAVEVSNSSRANGARVQIWERAYNADGGVIATQTVRVKAVANNTVVLLNGNSGKCLDVCDQSTKAGAVVHQWEITSAQMKTRMSAQWIMVDAGGGWFYLINMNSGKALDVSNAHSANGTGLIQYHLNYSSAQKFKFIPVADARRDNNEAAVMSRLESMMNGSYGSFKLGTRYSGTYAGYQCKGFAMHVFKECFGVSIGSTSGKPYNYLISNNSSETTCIGTLTGMSGRSDGEIKSLFANARAGDFVQIRRAHTGSHSAIYLYSDDSSVTFYEANLDGANGIVKRSYSWSALAEANEAMSVYTANDYRLH